MVPAFTRPDVTESVPLASGEESFMLLVIFHCRDDGPLQAIQYQYC